METCRACLTTEGQLAPLDELFVNAYNLITNLNIALSDAMPQRVCQGCIQAVKFCIDFRDRCTTTETTLQEMMIQKIKSEHEKSLENTKESKVHYNIEIEPEIKVENQEESYFVDDDNDFGGFNSDVDYPLKTETDQVVKNERENPKRRKSKRIVKPTLTQRIEKIVKKLQCGLCESSFVNKEDLSQHIEGHRNDRQCKLCPETADTWPGLVGHRLKHIPYNKTHRCHMCNKAAFSPLNMELHYMEKHFGEVNSKLSCTKCSRTYNTVRKLSKHIRNTHSGKSYVCNYCNKVYKSKNLLSNHIKIHSENKTYMCDLCGFSCKLSSGLRDHKIRKHAPDRVNCPSCKRAFATRAHYEKHTCNNKNRICPICGRVITKGFSEHVSRHTKMFVHKCTRCPAKFKSKGSLKEHMDRHDGIRTKQCEFCPLKFYTMSVLIKHRRTHTGERPYVCKICQKGFMANYNLKVHMRVHGEHLVIKRSTHDGNLGIFKVPPPTEPDFK